MLHWYFLVKEVCRSKSEGPDSRNADNRIIAGGSGGDGRLDAETRRIYLWAGLGEIAPLFAGGLAAVLVESAALSWLAVGLGLLGTALVIAILWRKYPIPPPPVEAALKPPPEG